MKAIIDRAGRIIVPKALRQALGLKAGQPLEIRAADGRREGALPSLTADEVRDTLQRGRR
jgi:AbrB family looped-hinge helix DNA binding protein